MIYVINFSLKKKYVKHDNWQNVTEKEQSIVLMCESFRGNDNYSYLAVWVQSVQVHAVRALDVALTVLLIKKSLWMPLYPTVIDNL